MADDAQYATNTDTTAATAKRKYDEQTTPPPPRRATGFSAPILTSSSPDLSSVPPPSYNTVPPPMDVIQIAKQRAQEIAARLSIDAAGIEAKRARVENGAGAGAVSYDSGGGDKGFSSYSSDFSQKPMISSTASQTPYSYGGGYQGSSKKVEIPNGRVGVIIGKGGETIKYLQAQSGAKIQVTRDGDVDPNSLTRTIELMGTPEAVEKAEQLINDVLSEAETGGSGSASRRMSGQSQSGDQFVMKIPTNKVGLVIGKGGETIKSMQAQSGARIQVIPLHPPPGDTSTERTIQIEGTSEQIESAKQLISEVTSENRPRNSSMGGGGGGYSQQGYQARPPTNWSQQGPPMQQQYGYVQPGAYPGTTPQYQQQGYDGGYPSQPNSGAYASNWDPISAPSGQQTTQGSGYDYYNQQSGTPQPGAPASADNNTGYNYNQQQPASGYNQQGQSYTTNQDGYGSGYNQAPGSQSSYNQVQPQGYDQQGYNNNAQAYGNVPNPTKESLTPSNGAPGDITGQTPPPVQPSAATGQQGYTASPYPGGYPSQPGYGYGTGGYGVPPTGYGQPSTQASYQHYQPNYAQPDSASQQAPTAVGATAPQPGYGAPPPYNAPGYGQQQPPSYSNSYGSGYGQPSAYASDPSDPAEGGGAQTGAPKASPSS